jgi:hypothetical protein
VHAYALALIKVLQGLGDLDFGRDDDGHHHHAMNQWRGSPT